MWNLCQLDIHQKPEKDIRVSIYRALLNRATIHDRPRPAIILLPPLTTPFDQPQFHHYHPRPPTISHDFASTTHDHPRSAIILPPPSTTTHGLPFFYHRHPRLRTLLKNELFRSHFSTTLHRLIEHAFWFANQSTDFFRSS